MPNRRAARAVKRPGGKTGSYSQYVVALLSQRDQHVAAITMLRSGKAAPSPFLGKAETLLTRYWARADWQAREEILRTVRWLLSLARLETAAPRGKVGAAKRVKRRSRMLVRA